MLEGSTLHQLQHQPLIERGFLLSLDIWTTIWIGLQRLLAFHGDLLEEVRDNVVEGWTAAGANHRVWKTSSLQYSINQIQ